MEKLIVNKLEKDIQCSKEPNRTDPVISPALFALEIETSRVGLMMNETKRNFTSHKINSRCTFALVHEPTIDRHFLIFVDNGVVKYLWQNLSDLPNNEVIKKTIQIQINRSLSNTKDEYCTKSS